MFTERFDKLNGTFESKFNELDPKLQQWRPAIEELKEKNEAFKELDDEVLIAIAKEKEMKPSMEYRGEAGGQRQRSGGEDKKAREFSTALPEAQLLLKMLGGDMEKAKRAFARAEAERIG